MLGASVALWLPIAPPPEPQPKDRPQTMNSAKALRITFMWEPGEPCLLNPVRSCIKNKERALKHDNSSTS
jgi:hypothetical protein